MQVHILIFDGRIERASMDASKMYEAGKEMNGKSNPFGSHNVISVELEDVAIPTSAMHSDGEGRCSTCGGRKNENPWCSNSFHL